MSRPPLVARNVSRETVLAERLENGSSFWAKFMGLMGRASLAHGDGLWLPGENGIHMLFMRFAIDVVFVSAPAGGRGGRAAGPVAAPIRAAVARCRVARRRREGRAGAADRHDRRLGHGGRRRNTDRRAQDRAG